MLIGAGVRSSGGPLRYFGAPLAQAVERNTWAQAGALRNWWAGDATVTGGASSANKSSVPDGLRHPASWLMSPKAGGMSSRNNAAAAFSASGAAVGGITTTGSAAFSINFAAATGGLITSGAGSASFAFGVAGAMTGLISGAGSASMSISVASALLGAIAGGSGSASFSFSGSLTPYAVGNMVGSTSGSTISADDLAASLLAVAIARATQTALEATAIPVNVTKVHGQTIDGSGTELDPWGPA